MKTRGVRLYGKDDLRLDTFELPEIKDDEILVKIYTDSICMSTYKLVEQGKAHKRCPQNVDTNPVIIGHEFAGTIEKVGKKWQNEFKPGEKFAQQPALNYKGKLDSPGYSYEFCGGASQYCIMPHEVMELGCLLHYDGDSFFEASLGEPVSCCIGGYHGNYHTNKQNYDHQIGVKPNGNLLIAGGCGPMGLGSIDYGIQMENGPARIVVTDISDERIAEARKLISEEYAAEHGVQLIYYNTAKTDDAKAGLMALTDGHGYDDEFIMLPNKQVAELGDAVLAFDGCLNFFAGPTNKDFTADINLYNCHYTASHIMGTTGGNTDDLKEALRLSSQGKIQPAVMVSHIGGLDCVAETTQNLPKVPGGKKLIYTQIDLPLTAIADFKELGKTDPLFKKLADSVEAHKGLWNTEAEQILMNHFNVD